MAATSAMTTRQIFNLRWNNHTNNMLQVFLDQLANEKLVDVTLSCEGKFLKVHRMVLSACSPYFQELFFHHKEQNAIIILNGIKFGDLKSVVNFMYCGEIEVAEQEMEGVLAVAEALEVKGLSDVRESYENRHRKSSASEEGDDGGGTHAPGVTAGEPSGNGKRHGGTLNKKRKFAEGVLHVNPMAKKEGGVGVNCVPDHPSLSVVPDEDGTQNCQQEIWVKEEIRDSDDEVTCADAPWNMTQGSVPSPKTSPQVNEAKGDSLLGIGSGFDRDSASQTMLCKQMLPESLNARLILPKTCEVVDTPLTFGNTARKTVFSQGRCKIPRPPNAFMVFANEWRRKLALLHHDETNKEISVRLGVMWKELSPDAKESYFAAARQADQEHKKRYPGYIYSPKEARMRKILRRVAVKQSSGGSLIAAAHGCNATHVESQQPLPLPSEKKKLQ